jgi:hypothetical protein
MPNRPRQVTQGSGGGMLDGPGSPPSTSRHGTHLLIRAGVSGVNIVQVVVV